MNLYKELAELILKFALPIKVLPPPPVLPVDVDGEENKLIVDAPEPTTTTGAP